MENPCRDEWRHGSPVPYRLPSSGVIAGDSWEDHLTEAWEWALILWSISCDGWRPKRMASALWPCGKDLKVTIIMFIHRHRGDKNHIPLQSFLQNPDWVNVDYRSSLSFSFSASEKHRVAMMVQVFPGPKDVRYMCITHCIPAFSSICTECLCSFVSH